MDFSTKRAPDGDLFVSAKGEIVEGDTERLRIALDSVGRNRYGNKEMALESGGGLVAEALKMVALMDLEKVSTIVLPGVICASACAQIVFLAGVHRVVADGGQLGFRGCVVGRASTYESPLCDEIIARNALEHGTDYRSVMAFMKYTGPSTMIWFSSKEADCYGYTRWPPGANRGTQPGKIAPCIEGNIAPGCCETSLTTVAGQETVRMEKSGGVYVVPVRFNNTITLNAVVDSGASDVSIPADIILTLIRSKTVTDEDFLGKQIYVLADGSKVPSQQLRIRSLTVGSKTIENVVASVASVNGEILLGQSFFSRFKSWSVDNGEHTLILR
jgi:gag-polyprotein putative aspartyl protease